MRDQRSACVYRESSTCSVELRFVDARGIAFAGQAVLLSIDGHELRLTTDREGKVTTPATVRRARRADAWRRGQAGGRAPKITSATTSSGAARRSS